MKPAPKTSNSSRNPENEKTGEEQPERQPQQVDHGLNSLDMSVVTHNVCGQLKAEIRHPGCPNKDAANQETLTRPTKPRLVCSKSQVSNEEPEKADS